MTTIKITELTDIGANLASSTVLPVVNMAGTPTTQKTILGNIANVILAGAGANYVAAAKATTANTVLTNAQPNITSTGSLIGLTVSNANGIVNFTTTANVTLGAVGNLHITGGTTDQLLTTDGAGNLSWTTVSGGGANTGNVTFDDVTVQGDNSQLNLSAGAEFTANLAYLQVRSGDVASHIHLDTGNNIAYDLIVGDDDKFVQVSSTGNIIMSSYDGNISYTMTLDTTGNLTVPGSIIGASTINIDNRATGNGADINLYSADDILIQARDRDIGSTSEGGDINIFAGDSAEDGDSSGGDVVIEAGDGGAANLDFGGSGGTIRLEAGQGGAASTEVAGTAAATGGELTLRAGDAGSNSGNIARGSVGGDVYIEAGDSTGDGDIGGSIYLTSGAADASGLAGNVVIQAGGTWTFDGTGNLTLPGNLNLTGGGINQASNETLLITTFDDNGIVSSSLELSPGDTTRLEQWSSQQSETFTTADWTTGVYINPGEGGAVQFTGAANIIAFINSLAGVGHIYFSVNGGTQLLPDGTSSGGGNITFYTPTPPATSPTVVTSFEYFYSYKSGFEIVSGEGTDVNIYGGDADITLQTTGQRDISLDSSGDVILTANSTVNWTFATTGNLTLPGNTFAVNYANGDQVSIGGNTGNVTFNDINIIGDGNLKLQPDSANANAYLNIYLTSGPDIHIAGNGETVILGTDDFANITVNVDGNVAIQANAGTPYTWQFDTTGNLTLPSGSTINNAPDIITVTLDQFTDGGYPGPQVFTKVSDTLYELSPGGPYMTLISAIWYLKISVSTYYSSTDLITWSTVAGGLPTPIGSPTAIITVNLETGGNVWTFGGDGVLTVPGVITKDTSLQLTSGGTSTTNGSSVNVYGDLGRVLLRTDNGTSNKDWQFNVDGTTSFPDNTLKTTNGANAAGSPGTAGAPLTITTGDGGIAATGFNAGAGGNITITAGDAGSNIGNPSWGEVGGELVLRGGNSTGPYWGGNVSIYSGNGPSTPGVISLFTGTNQWTFSNDGNLTLPTGGNLIVSGSIVSSGASPAPTLSGFSSVSALEFKNGTSNVTVNSNSNLWTFDSTGNLTIPGSSGGFIKTVANASIGIAAVDNGTNNPAQLISMTNAGAATSIISAYATNATIQTNATGTINTWAFDNAGNLSAPGTISAINFTGNGAGLSNVATKVAGSWTLASGNNTVSISVPLNGTYALWVNGNIPNGIITYTATAVVTNTNVPVLGEQYGWYYVVGNALVLTSLPNQFTGTVGSISNVNTYLGNTANVFTFGITNNSGNTAVVNYGYTKL
jgi:hypothetical protein